MSGLLEWDGSVFTTAASQLRSVGAEFASNITFDLCHYMEVKYSNVVFYLPPLVFSHVALLAQPEAVSVLPPDLETLRLTQTQQSPNNLDCSNTLWSCYDQYLDTNKGLKSRVCLISKGLLVVTSLQRAADLILSPSTEPGGNFVSLCFMICNLAVFLLSQRPHLLYPKNKQKCHHLPL